MGDDMTFDIITEGAAILFIVTLLLIAFWISGKD